MVVPTLDMKEEKAMGLPAMTSSNFHAYFFMPAAWIGQVPTADDLANSAHVEPVLSHMLSNFIRIYAFRDGVFTFDFANWPDASPVNIPAYEPVDGKKPPKAWDEAMKLAQDHHYKSTSVMNAHLACLMTALSQTQGLGVYATQFVTPDSYFTTNVGGGARFLTEINIVKPREVWGYEYVQTADDRKGQQRVLIEEKTARRSFVLLDQILTSPVPDALLITTLIYRAVINIGEHDFATALTLSWTVCEKLLRVVWDRYLDKKNETITKADGQIMKTINSERRELLKGRDYTASIISEALALAGEISHETYLKLKSVRQARNGWLHFTKPIASIMAFEAVDTAQRMLKEVADIDLAIPPRVGHRL